MTGCDACGFYARDDCPRNQHTCCLDCGERCWTDYPVGPASVVVPLLCPCGGACHGPGDLCDATCCEPAPECQPGCESCTWEADESRRCTCGYYKADAPCDCLRDTDCDGSESCECLD